MKNNIKYNIKTQYLVFKKNWTLDKINYNSKNNKTEKIIKPKNNKSEKIISPKK